MSGSERLACACSGSRARGTWRRGGWLTRLVRHWTVIERIIAERGAPSRRADSHSCRLCAACHLREGVRQGVRRMCPRTRSDPSLTKILPVYLTQDVYLAPGDTDLSSVRIARLVKVCVWLQCRVPELPDSAVLGTTDDAEMRRRYGDGRSHSVEVEECLHPCTWTTVRRREARSCSSQRTNTR